MVWSTVNGMHVSYSEEAAKKRAAAADAAQRNSARILEEEKAKDRAWRDAVAHVRWRVHGRWSTFGHRLVTLVVLCAARY